MNDSSITPILLSSAAHLENVEQLIKNLEKNTANVEDFGDILNNDRRHELITKSFSSVCVNDMTIDDDENEDNFLVKSISMVNNGATSTDSLFNDRPLFDNDDYKKQQTPPGIDQSLFTDQETAFTWDDQYDTRANYRLTFSHDKHQKHDGKSSKSHRQKQHHHKRRTNDCQTNSICSDDGIPTTITSQMNDWSMRSSTLNALDQSIDQVEPKTTNLAHNQGQTVSFLRSQSQQNSSSPSQTTPVNNNSPNSSSTSSSSSASWRRNREIQRTTLNSELKESRAQSPMNLYKIFQQKTQSAAASSTARSAFQYYRQQNDSVVPNVNDSMTISGEKILSDRSRMSNHQKSGQQIERRSAQTASSNTDQAIQTSMLMDSTTTMRSTPKSESFDRLTAQTHSNSPNLLNVPSRPATAPIGNSTIHKSLPDLAFISQYSKEIPRSRTVSPAPIVPQQIVTPNPSTTINTNKTDNERRRTLKSIKRYKSSKHSTEPLNVFFSPQLGKTFAAVPASAIFTEGNDGTTVIKMKITPPSSQTNSSLKSCLKYGSRANSCDIQAMLDDGRTGSSFNLPQPIENQYVDSPSSKRRCSETDTPPKRPDELFRNREMPRDHYSEHDLALFLQQQNQAKKSVSFSENIAKHLISPCNPAIKFDNEELAVALHGEREVSTRKPTARYGEMRRCQTDIIVVDRVHHLHSFTESPPNEFRLQENDSLLAEAKDGNSDDDDQAIMEKTHVNIVPEIVLPEVSVPHIQTEEKQVIQENGKGTNSNSSNNKENEIPLESTSMNISTITTVAVDDPTLEGLLEKFAETVRHIFDVKRSDKSFFLINNKNNALDSVLKDELCVHIQFVLEHGRKSQTRELSTMKTVNLWDIIETSLSHGSSLQVFHEAKQSAQGASTYWLFKFQSFIYALLNKNQLINWLYNFTKQKDILLRYYNSPGALILLKTDPKFQLFDRIMVQLEKLNPLGFRLTYQAPAMTPSQLEETAGSPNGNGTTSRSSSRDWMRPIARRTTKTLTQPIPQPSHTQSPTSPVNVPTTDTQNPSETIRSTLTRRINALFNKNPTPQAQRKVSSAVTAKLPTPKASTVQISSPSSTRRGRLSNVFATSPTPTSTTISKPVIASSPKLSSGQRSSSIRRAISPTIVVAPSPPPAINSNNSTGFQSKIPRPSLNVDKPKSARYRSSALPPK